MTCPSSPFIQSASKPPILSLNSCEDVRICSETVEVQIHVLFVDFHRAGRRAEWVAEHNLTNTSSARFLEACQSCLKC